ncbi:MAG: alpha-amylase family glycosyl hydrolase [Ignavibacteriaceae bacterium]|jgi:glycosidase
MIKFDFHVRKYARDKYQFDNSLFSITGDLIIANFHQARVLSNKINLQRKAEGKADRQVSASEINAFGLIHEIFHFLIRYYEDKENPGVLLRGINYLNSGLGEKELNKIFIEYLNEFPPLEVYTGKLKPEEFLSGHTGNKLNTEIILEEILLLYLENINQAASKLDELYSDKNLAQKTKYAALLEYLESFFSKEKPFGAENLPLISFLKKPILNSPHNIEGQLEYIRQKWGIYIYDKFNQRLLSSKDLILEELGLFFHFAGGNPTPPVPDYKTDEEYLRQLKAKLAAGEKLTEEENRFYHSEIEKFTEDIDWMPKVVMIAKNVFVWLDQLSKKYGRLINRLDQIPDEELDTLARWNFSALWLIGLWERSSASRKIKQITGNPEATSSAYSLYDYAVANDLGGEEAFQNFKERAWQRGIRLASDMVPNHTGIYSKWVVEKPDYFIQSDYPPFPGYSFNGPNLSDDNRVEVRIEDKYYTREDAAVVFQRKDSYTGEVKYFYHGNDGTNMPWNDTSQLNLMKAEVRAALIQTIKHVAKRTPIIRFDAAMTLTKKHYQRLWFPQPGTGGAIPSRSDFAMTPSAFDLAMPLEFWREVVDTINSEMPDTLLLAEAFWLMEGYFVRTLGMHRVYNSAFMHMLMKEENNKYRDLIKNTLEFNPEILKRYVSFMSNPDEETAINQFGKGDKYFGVSVLMVTLPGLPMFAHGQIEGLSEKYGMEYKRAYYNEFPDNYLIRRHEEEIFPLMRKRHLFSQVTNFELYTLTDEAGNVNENVFAFTNKAGNEKALVVYNNAYLQSSGSINYTAGKAAGEGSKNIRVKKLGEALDFENNFKKFYTFKDHRTKLEYLISGKEVFTNGLSFSLSGYEYRVLLDFKEIFDEKGEYERLSYLLNDSGVPSIEYALKELKLTPVHERFNNLFNYGIIDELKKYCFIEETVLSKSYGFKNILTNVSIDRLNNFINEVRAVSYLELKNEKIIDNLFDSILDVKFLYENYKKLNEKGPGPSVLIKNSSFLSFINSFGKNGYSQVLFVYLIIKNIFNSGNDEIIHIKFFSDLLLEKALFEIIKASYKNVDDIYQNISLIKTLLAKDYLVNKRLTEKNFPSQNFISELISGQEACDYVLLNEFEGNIYYNRERFDSLINWLFALSYIKEVNRIRNNKTIGVKYIQKLNSYIKSSYLFIDKIKNASDNASYKILELNSLLGLQPKPVEKKPIKKKPAVKATKSAHTPKTKAVKKKEMPGNKKKRI